MANFTVLTALLRSPTWAAQRSVGRRLRGWHYIRFGRVRQPVCARGLSLRSTLRLQQDASWTLRSLRGGRHRPPLSLKVAPGALPMRSLRSLGSVVQRFPSTLRPFDKLRAGTLRAGTFGRTGPSTKLRAGFAALTTEVVTTPCFRPARQRHTFPRGGSPRGCSASAGHARRKAGTGGGRSRRDDRR